MNNAIAGGIAGLLATVPMTVAMELMHDQLPPQEQYPLPPREITEKISEEAGVDDDMSETQHRLATVAAHFSYGSACGAVYGFAAPALPGPPIARGVAFGLAVWTTSYLGVLPSLGILRPAQQHPKRRNALMLAAHVIWGVATGVIVEALINDE